MDVVEKATQTQLANIQKKTGKSLDELAALVKDSGLQKHGEIREMLKANLAIGHGDANTLTHFILKSGGEQVAQVSDTSGKDMLDEIYSGPKAAMRPIHDRLMEKIHTFGEFNIAPKKGYVSLRRKKQFAMIGPATNSRVEVGLNQKSLAADPRLIEQKPGSMCNYVVKLTQAEEVDQDLLDWIRQAYESAG